MIDFRCPHCGKGLQVEDGRADTTVKCVACGETVVVPEPVVAKGIRLQEGGLGTPIGAASAAEPEVAPPPGVAKRFSLAEATCQIWRAGEMPPPENPEHPVADVSRSGMRVTLGKRAKRRTLVHVQQAPWKEGDQVELDLKVGAFAKPIRVYAEVARLKTLGLGQGSELGLKITKTDEDGMRRLELLEQREDLRQKRKRGSFDH